MGIQGHKNDRFEPEKAAWMPRAVKKLFVKTYGCQMNQYDSDRLFEVMGEIGFESTDEMPVLPGIKSNEHWSS